MTRTAYCPACGFIEPLADLPEKNRSDVQCSRCGSLVEIASVKEGTTPSRSPTVLCIDDDPLVLGSLRDALERGGYRALLATDPFTGIETAKQERPSLVLIDIMMPGMDGFEACRRLRADPDLRATPIILLTALHISDLDQRASQAGATLSVHKPFEAESVVDIIGRTLGRRAQPPGV